jgi:hypothetical protein
MSKQITHAYVIRASCGHPIELVVDDGRPLSVVIPSGGTVEHVPLQEARAAAADMYGCTSCAPPL